MTIHWDKDADRIVTLTMDAPGGANTVTPEFGAALAATLDRVETEKDDITGVVLTSAKKTFFAGMDLDDLVNDVMDQEPAELLTLVAELKAGFRRIETCGVPVVAAINGAALGGGLELAYCCHHRIAADVPGSQIGLPEVLLGLLPGAGGVVRTVRLIGIQPALMNVLLTGARMKPAKALEVGVIDEVVALDELIPAAKAWIKANPDKNVQPWDVKGYKIPGGSPTTPAFAQNLPAFPANLHKNLKGNDHMPAPRAILAAAVEGAQVDFNTAELIESRYFVSLVKSQVAKNMVQAFFFDLQKVQGGAARPDGIEKKPIKKVGILGAGMMGAGIAYVTARAGIEVVLKDVTIEAAHKGKAWAEAKARGPLATITATADARDFEGVDFVVEAVFEKTELKNAVFQEIENIVDPGAVLGSNTSSLPITGLAAGVQTPENFIGIHFFSPVEKMDPVEIIRGEKTSDETLARAIDYVLAIRKYPIVVNDGRGFFTTRVFSVQLLEALTMLAEGIDPAIIEQAAFQAGYPVAPLQMCDELSFGTIRKILDETIAADGPLPESVTAASEVIDRMLSLERSGKQAGAGFYDYADGRRAALWTGLRDEYHTSRELKAPFTDLQDRFLFIQTIETQHAYDDGVINSDPDAKIGSIFGIGFPAWTGGVRQFVAGYPGGPDAYAHRAAELADNYGTRFTIAARNLTAQVKRPK